jgi:hypothetical protein
LNGEITEAFAEKVKTRIFSVAEREKSIKTNDLSSWYTAKSSSVKALRKWLRRNGLNLPRALAMVYPDHRWLSWKFNLPKNYWQNRENVVGLLRHTVETKNLDLNSYYSVSSQALKLEAGEAFTRIFRRRKGGIQSLLRETFPDHDWLEWKFKTVPRGFWLDTATQVRFLQHVECEMGFSGPEGWYNVKAADFSKLGGPYLSFCLAW